MTGGTPEVSVETVWIWLKAPEFKRLAAIVET